MVIGAYPSALHVRWAPPKPWKQVQAIGVDNEPTPFWTGEDEVDRVEAWKASVHWVGEWGTVTPAGKLNGSSGVWLTEKVLTPLGVERSDAWITDCLDTYCASAGAAERLADTYRPFAAAMGLLADEMKPHPSEGEIVEEALRVHRQRLLMELDAARPEMIVTLGNAALRVLVGITSFVGLEPKRLTVDRYGREQRVEVAGRSVAWLPLAHPGAPNVYQRAHDAWILGGAGRGR